MTNFNFLFINPAIVMFVVAVSLLSCKKETLKESDNLRIETLSSVYTGTEYKIQVLYPSNYDVNKAYHTVYLLDADDYFREVAHIIKNQYEEKIVLVGIGYKGKNKRTTDFTYPADNMISKSGGGIQFLHFLTDELVPYIDSIGIRSGQKTLIGHSLGAYISLYLTFQKQINNPFQNIIAVSPSLFWHDAYLFNLEQTYFDNNKDLNVNLYMAIGDIEGLTMNTHFRAFTGRITGRRYNNLLFNYETLRKASHNNTPITGFEKGLLTIQ